MFKLFLFRQTEGPGEYVAILDADEDAKEYCPAGYSVIKILDIDDDATDFPTNRLLVSA